MQIVYISNRPDSLLKTLESVAIFMPWIEQAIVCMPDNLITQVKQRDSAVKLSVVGESEILSTTELADLASLDHQKRNYLLRTRLVAHPEVEPCFIMSDDDARPLKTIPQTLFLDNNQYHCYFFHDLRQWPSNQTEFDRGQLNTGVVLEYLNLPKLSYASHMPQIIDQALFLEAAKFFADYAHRPLCEWSSYFNYATHKYPERFSPAEPFKTLCWPEHPLAWRPIVDPDEYCFENYTPSCYDQQGPFHDLDQTSHPISQAQLEQQAIDKIVRWQQYTLWCLHPEQRDGWQKYLHPRTWTNKLLKTPALKR